MVRENSHGRAGNRIRDFMIKSQRLWALDHEAGLISHLKCEQDLKCACGFKRQLTWTACIVTLLQKSHFVINQMVIAILGDKSGDGLAGQEKGHRVEEDNVGRNMPEICFGYNRKKAARSNTETAPGASCVPYGTRREVGWSGMRSAECLINEGCSSNE